VIDCDADFNDCCRGGFLLDAVFWESLCLDEDVGADVDVVLDGFTDLDVVIGVEAIEADVAAAFCFLLFCFSL
jgi:hypothetical protein